MRLAVANPKYRMGDKVRGVKGPGGSMEPERRNLGREGFITGVCILRGAGCHHYTVLYSDTSTDHIDETCLERA